MNSEHHALLVLSTIPGIGSVRLRALVSTLGSAGAVAAASGHQLIGVEGIERKTAAVILAFYRGRGAAEGRDFADRQLHRLGQMGGRLVSWWDPEYPPLLKKSDEPPPFLFLQGTLEERDAGALAVVGTRSPSAYGVRVAEELTEGIASLGITIVSGLARGIDTIAHATCVRRSHRTLAVIGSGLDVIYPSENYPLSRRIASGGAVITELPLGAKPDAVNFPRRNRIVSGMTLGTLVIETGPEGGAMITAALALEQGREVFAVPASLNKNAPSGTNRLIKEGRAKLTESVDDILVELAPRLKSLIPAGKVPRPLPPVDLTLFERTVADVLSDEAVHIDLIASRAGIPAGDALVHLLSLEFKGVARQLRGKMFRRA
jgi:DNA processing protein